MDCPLDVRRDGPVLEVTINRPPANAINRDLSRLIYDAFAQLRDDPDLRVGIITGAGDHIFSAGWDLKQVANGEIDPDRGDDVNIGNGPGGFAGLSEFWDLNKPVIAAVNGYAVGGGFEMALSVDLILAAEHAEFFLPEMGLGLLPDAGAVQILARRIPYNVAMEMMLTGRRMSAEEGHRWGLVNEILPFENLMSRARELAAQLAEGSPLATLALKEVMRATMHLPVRDAFMRLKTAQRLRLGDRSDLPHYKTMLNSEDFREGPLSFSEKRMPVWKNR